jgi:N6-L-threonylcarbamoyladenine synthase
MTAVLGLDTSNYTTSAAVYRSDGSGANAGKLLEVPEGGLGLRQSDALFQHVRRLPDRIRELRQQGLLTDLAAVGASTAPREVEGSYMPCFLAGVSQAQVLSDVLNVPFYACSHQQGHVAAAAWSAGHLELLDRSFLTWHLSGGTTELLLAKSVEGVPHMTLIGGTEDISAGQLIDRTGKLLNLAFPAGRALDALAEQSDSEDRFPVKLRGLHFSLSGVENQVKQRIERGVAPEDVARFTLNTVADLVYRVTEQAKKSYSGLPVLCSGGVASNALLRAQMEGALFAEPRYSTDNAMGVAILTHRALERGLLS